MNNINVPKQILLVSSRSDPAGSMIHEEVKKLLVQRPDLEDRYLHRQFDERLIYIDGPSLDTSADCIIFLSRHASKEPRPILTVHVTGNYGPADYGGAPGTLTKAATGMMHAILNRLASDLPAGYAISYEATHHGPTLVPVPSCFVEVGSTEVEWQDRSAAAAVARAVISARPKEVIPLAGFGGTHYAKRQTEITLMTRGGFGHIIPTRALIYLTKNLFTDIVRDSGAVAIYIDRKSVKKDDIRRIEEYANELKLPVVGQSDLIGFKNISFKDYIQ
ncbi:MAG: D-aminoacyl-tRNA deacylase, partial [Methanobacteriota archaeon]